MFPISLCLRKKVHIVITSSAGKSPFPILYVCVCVTSDHNVLNRRARRILHINGRSGCPFTPSSSWLSSPLVCLSSLIIGVCSWRQFILSIVQNTHKLILCSVVKFQMNKWKMWKSTKKFIWKSYYPLYIFS